MNDPIRPNDAHVVPAHDLSDLHEVARLQLLEERAVVERVQEHLGHVMVSRLVETRTVQLPAEETIETLIIEVAPGAGVVTIDGQELRAGERREIEVYRETARVVKETVAYQDVRVLRRRITNEQTLAVELGREVLAVEDPQHLIHEDRIVDAPLNSEPQRDIQS